jgi:nucleoside-diphosphate-sugar epimerase
LRVPRRALRARAMSDRAKATNLAGRPVLVTGGAGFIGSHLVDALLEAGARVRVIDNFATGRRDNLNPRAELLDADITRPDSMRGAFDGIDTVFHAAALARIPLSIERPVETHMANVVGTLNVLIAARDARVRRFVNSGSSSVYGEQASLPLRESMAPNPLNPYALQKYVGEQYARMFHALFGMQTVTLRYFNAYGPRMASEGAYVTAIAAFLRARRDGRPLEIFGDGDQTRDFTHVSDVVRANLLAADAPVADGRALNIGCGRNVSINRIAGLIGGEAVHKPARPGEMRHTLADISDARRALNWEPAVSVEQGIAALLGS